jgi:DNA-binding CsgD family transcriptional regulator
VRKHVLIFGIVGGLLIATLQAVEYRYIVVERSVEIYGAIVASLFAAVGIWLGRKLTRTREVVREVPVEVQVPVEVPVPVEVHVPVEVRVEVPVAAQFVRDARKQDSLGITPRELEILELIAAGLSNREIAERVHVSENTVKTHSSRVFDKLGARRRTQAVQFAKDQRLIP